MRQYRDWEIQQGIPEAEALAEARRRHHMRAEAEEIKAEGGFDAELLFGHPSYAGERPHLDASEGWRPYPRYPTRSQLEQLSSAEVARGADGTPIAYRLSSA